MKKFRFLLSMVFFATAVTVAFVACHDTPGTWGHHSDGPVYGSGGGGSGGSSSNSGTGTTVTTQGMIMLSAGTFTMGINSDAHSVTLTRAFWICDHEVTQAEYIAVKGTNPSSFTGDESRPVECVSWNDAIEYCNQLSTNEGLTPCYTVSGSNVTCDFSANGYRLPTEAEWEYAARAGDTTMNAETYSGTTTGGLLGNYAWYAVNSGNTTHPVKTKQPNANGLYDMSGNVHELCWDWYGSYSGDATNPTGSSSGSYRVSRGGHYTTGPTACTVSHRNGVDPDGRSDGLGFRVVRTAQ